MRTGACMYCIKLPLPAHIWEDNQSTICLAKTGRSCSERSRHIEIRYFWIHNFLTSGQVILEHLHTDQMIADMFTKPLQGSKFKSSDFYAEMKNNLLRYTTDLIHKYLPVFQPIIFFMTP